MSTRIHALFNIRPSEASIVGLLVLFSFGQGLFFSLFTVVSGALFLTSFSTFWFPKLYLIQGILGFILVNAYSRFQRVAPLKVTVLTTLGCCLALTAFFAAALLLISSEWLGFAMNCMVTPMITVTNITFWSMASRLFDLEQSKRLNALIGSGQPLISLAGFLSYRLLVGRVQEDAVFIMVACLGLILCLISAMRMMKHFRKKQDEEAKAPQKSTSGDYANSYFASLSLTVILAVVMGYLADYAFYGALNQEHMGNREAIGAILAVFLGLCRLLELAGAAFGGRLLHAFGLLASLLLLPCVALAVVCATLFFHGAFFPMMGLVQLLVIVLGVSVYGPSARLFFQPLDQNIRYQAQTRIEGGMSQVGIVIVSLGLMFVNEIAEPMRLIPWIMAVVLVGWIGFVLVSYRQYNGMIMNALGGLRQSVEPPELAQTDLKSTLLNTVYQFRLRLLSSQERVPLVKQLESKGLTLVGALRSEEPAAVHLAREVTESMRWAKRVAKSPGQVFTLAGSEDPAVRQEAALFLCFRRDQVYLPALDRLLQDRDPDIRRMALIAAGFQGRRDYWPILVDHLDSPYVATAAAVLVYFGGPVLHHKELSYLLFFRRPDLLKKLVALCPSLAGPEARNFLVDKLGWPNQEIEIMVLNALQQLDVKTRADEFALVHHRIRVNLLRYTWFQAALRDIPEDEQTRALLKAVGEESESIYQIILMLLNLICDGPALALICENLKGKKVRRDYALEIAQDVIPSQLHGIIFPLLEGGSPQQILARMGNRFAQPVMNRNTRLEALISRGNSAVGPWMRTLAIQALEQGGQISDALVANLYSEIPLVREAAASAIFKLDPHAFNRYIERIDEGLARKLRSLVLRQGDNLYYPLSALDKIEWLSKCGLFDDTARETLVRKMVEVEEIRAVAGSVLIHESQNDTDLYLLTHGKLRIEGGGSVRHATPPEIVGERNRLLWENATVTATGYCRLLKISPQLLYES